MDRPKTSVDDLARGRHNHGNGMMTSEGNRLQMFHRMWQLSTERWAVAVVEAA